MNRAILFAAIGLGLVLRLALAIAYERPLVSDEQDYDAIARSLAETGRYEEDGIPTAVRAPIYPWFVSGFYRAGGDARAVAAAQGLLDILVALFLYRLLARRDARAARIAAVGWALYPAAVLYARLLLSETLFTLGLVAWIAMLDRPGGGGARRHFFLGAWLGALALIRPIALVLAATLPWLSRYEEGPRAPRVLSFLLGLALVLSPWIGRNIVVLGTPTLSTSIGGNLLIGNHPRATGAYAPPDTDDRDRLDRDEVRADRESLRRATGYVVSHPDRFLRNGVLKLAHTARPEGELIVHTFLLRPETQDERHRVLLGRIPLWLYGLVSGPYMLVVLLGLLGLAALPRDRLRDSTIAMASAWGAVIFVFLGASRFHQPLMPVLMLVAARATGLTRAQLAAVPLSRWVLLAVLLAGLVGVWSVEARFVLRAAG